MPRLPPEPQLDWHDESAPRAAAFDDIYYSREGGLAEAEAVFLGGCGLPEAWRGRDRFAICELGFGSGLNVLAAWRAWRATHEPNAILHISSIEAFPLARADAARALSQFPEIANFAERLLARWPVRAYAPQRLWFPEDGFALTLHIGEAATVLASLRGRFDAWFLDGFAPARNPAMWTPEIFARMAALSAPDARVATFTVAAEVRRNLEAVGFQVEKKPGHGRKRERLEARRAPNFHSPTISLESSSAPRPKRVAVLGAGIAGACVAAALGRRGVEAIVLDAAPHLGAGASGNPAGLVSPRLDRGGALAEVFLAAYLEAVAAYEELGVLQACGVEQRARANQGEALADLIADPPLPDDWMRACDNGAAWHARAGLVRPLAAIEKLLAGAELIFDADIAAIEPMEAGWRLRDSVGRAALEADAVVLASGAGLGAFAAARFLPIELSRGQIEWGRTRSGAPAHAVTQGAYAAPFEQGVLFGATFDRVSSPDGVAADAASRRRNLEALAALAPDLAERLDLESLRSRASLRAATPDRAPIAGALPDAALWPTPGARGLYILGGLGARGLTLAPLLGEAIVSLMFDEPQALSAPALDAIDPARFLRRRSRRGF